ncbi:MAG: hypothetical protein ACFE0Q_16905 [Anaerolineae bacterium]
MISLKLWRALSKPPRRHPLFQYVLSNAKREQPRVTSGFVVWAFMLATALFIWTVLFQPLMWAILVAFIALNSVYATRWVVRIARTITRAKETRRYDLFGALPDGLLGTSWALSTGAMHQRSSFRWVPYLVMMTVISAFIALCGLTTITLTLIDELSDTQMAFVQNLDFVRLGISIMPFLAIFYIDHIYSILTAIVIAQISTIDVQDASEAQIRALLGFLSVQILIYTAALVLVFLSVPALFRFFGFTEVSHLVMIGILNISIFVALREGAIYVLWRGLTQALEADSREIALVIKPFYEAEAILKESEQARARYRDASR